MLNGRNMAILALVATALPVQALVPPLPCDGITEDGMSVAGARMLGHESSGLVIEKYTNAYARDDSGTYVRQPGPVPELAAFTGMRVTDCASGRILAFDSYPDPIEVVVGSLRATEFLRDAVKAERKVTLDQVRAAVRAVYGPPIELRENEETCGCDHYHPGLRPASFTPFADRGDDRN